MLGNIGIPKFVMDLMVKYGIKLAQENKHKVVEVFDYIHQKYGVTASYMVIHESTDELGKRNVSVTVMGTYPNGEVTTVKDEKGEDLVFPIEKIVGLLQGSAGLENDDDDDEKPRVKREYTDAEKLMMQKDRYFLKNGEKLDDLDPADKYLEDED